MKRLLLLLIASLFLFGCATTTAKDSEFYEHNAMYKSWSHLWYSWYGYKHCTPEDVKKSQAERWWGTPEEPCP